MIVFYFSSNLSRRILSVYAVYIPVHKLQKWAVCAQYVPTDSRRYSILCLYAQKAVFVRNAFFVIFENKPVNLSSG